MKKVNIITSTAKLVNKFLLMVYFLLMSLPMVLGQDMPKVEKPEVNINVEEAPSGGGYGSWWMWAVGIAIFIIIIVALTSRGRRRD